MTPSQGVVGRRGVTSRDELWLCAACMSSYYVQHVGALAIWGVYELWLFGAYLSSGYVGRI